MTTKNAVNLLLRAIGTDGMDGKKVLAHSLSSALDRLMPSEVPDEHRLRAIAEVRRQSLVEISHSNKLYHIRPSVKGIHRLQRSQVERIIITTPKTWDGLWRMVTYDVPRAQSAQRRLFARQLTRLGFTMLRESVWLHPYSCFKQVEELMAYCSLQRHVTFAEITRLDTISLGKLKRAYPEL